jgi:hypothetical protein
MTLSKKQRQQLKATMKRRELRPVSSYQPPATLEITPRERDRITRTNSIMLLGIESLIVKTWTTVPELNDHDVEQALISAIRQTPLSAEGPAQKLAEALQEKSKQYTGEEVPDEDWTMALRAILGSVRTRMAEVGSRHYLHYAEKFIANATRSSRPALS